MYLDLASSVAVTKTTEVLGLNKSRNNNYIKLGAQFLHKIKLYLAPNKNVAAEVKQIKFE